MQRAARILLAEDEEITAAIIQELLAPPEYEITSCVDGRAAWEHLSNHGTQFDVILLDRGLPHISGMELLRRIKADPSLTRIPVVMETASGDEESIRQGLREGAYYYLTKPFLPDVLLAVVNAALAQAQELRAMIESVQRAERPLALLQTGTFRFRDLDEARLLANSLARICPDPERAIQGLQELLVNAVEHGNLAISYAEKGALVLAGTWQDEVHRRLHNPLYRDRAVEVIFQREPELLRFTIKDQGAGFDWERYLDFSPERIFDPNGRGIAMAKKLSFDGLEYQGVGNRVIATVALAPGIVTGSAA